MKLSAKMYAIFVSIAGVAVGLFCIYEEALVLLNTSSFGHELGQLIVLFLLTYLCRCLPIYIRPDFSIDMAFIAYLAMILCKGPIVAAAITFIGSPFIVVPGPGPERKPSHIFNTQPIKTAFNTGNFTLSVFFGGVIFKLVGGTPGNLAFPEVILPMLCLVLSVVAINNLILILLFKLNMGIPFFKSYIANFLDFLPSIIAAAPIGFFIATFMIMKEGEYLVILFILPLFLARFAFSMYVDVKQNYFVILKTLTNAIEAKDQYTRGHSQRVEQYAEIIAKEMHFSPNRLENLKIAALLHDVGKIGIDENILTKPGYLTDEERKIIQTHPLISVEILKSVNLAPIVFEIVRHHHERYDGNGYPDGKGGDEIPIDVYVICVADTYDAITSERPYSKGRTEEKAYSIITEEKGKQFHPEVVEAFERAYEKGHMGLIERDALRSSFFEV